MCRSRKGDKLVQLAENIQVSIGATISFGPCQAIAKAVQGNRVRLTSIQGQVPAVGEFAVHSHAYDVDDMSQLFHNFWAQVWLRDSPEEQQSDEAWQDVLGFLDNHLPTHPTLQIRFDEPELLWQSVHRLKPYKAIGVDGWRAEELQLLSWNMVADLTKLLAAVCGHGLTARQMQARTMMFAKRDSPTSISDGRPITILGYIARLTSKLISAQILTQWASYWPPQIRGGLPSRSARDLSLMQMSVFETAKTQRTAWCGWTMDLVKAFNLIPRRVTRHILTILGLPAYVIDCWFKSLSRLTRALQCGKSLGVARPSTTGLPEGDSMSVVGVLAVSYAFHTCLKSPQVHPYTYAADLRR